MTELTKLISDVGFPIVAFILCAYGLKYSYDKSLEQMNHTMEQIAKLTEAVNNNTVVLAKLVEKVEGVDNESN